jgi:methionyl aminopeptidase
MRKAGRVVAEMLASIREAARPGVTLLQLDDIAREVVRRRGARPSFLGYHGYPAAICASVNDVVVHGIPTSRALADGDVLSIDCGAIVEGWNGDAAITMTIGEAGKKAADLISAAELALHRAIDQTVAGNRVGDISRAIERTARGAGFAVVRDFTGHGIGRAMHEPPDVPNHTGGNAGPRLTPGMALAIEPILVAGSPDVRVLDDGWTVMTCDGSLAAHVEHTVLITDNGPEVTTVP